MIGWQCFRKRELPPLEKRRETTLASTVVWLKGASAPELLWMPLKT